MNNEAIKKIADTYGYDAQSRQLIEEMAELTVAVNKFYRNIGKPNAKTKVSLKAQYFITSIIEEIADVIIMLEQMKYLLQISNEEIDEIIEQKLNRQLERIGKNE